jgi:amino acid transporter
MEATAPAADREHGLKKERDRLRRRHRHRVARPAYSLAAVLAIVVVTVGVQAPAVLLASFVPMFLIASAFYYMNRADPDCGTTFSWVTRALGPALGWVAGWAVCTTGIIVIGSLADVGAYYIFAIVIIGLMTWTCVLGTELSAHVQRFMIAAQVIALLIFAGVALIKVAAGDAPEGSVDPSLSWFSLFAVDSVSLLVLGLLTGVFIYWGWESAVNLNEETTTRTARRGLAAVVSTVICS